MPIGPRITDEHMELLARLELRSKFRDFFREIAKERPKRENLVAVPGEPGWRQCAWIVYERGMMHALVNAERQLRKLEPITVEKYTQVEAQAVGHSDYADKLALYCAELALGERS